MPEGNYKCNDATSSELPKSLATKGVRAMRESRLFQIVYHLLEKGQATAPELAEKLEVSVRTIYRDIDALSGAGIPVYTKEGRNGGICLMRDFVLEKAVLSEEEKQEILMALQSINVTQNRKGSQTLEKLSAIFQSDSPNWLEVDFSRWGQKEFDNEKFERLKMAVIQCKSVKLHYAGSCGAIYERIVQPCKLAYKENAWYLQAFCTQKQDFRMFKLNRILDLEILDERFSHREFPNCTEDSGREYPPVTLRFSKEMAYRVYDAFDETQIQRQENGDLIASARMPHDAWLIGFLLSFGTQVDVLSPICLKRELAEQAKLIYEKNKT